MKTTREIAESIIKDWCEKYLELGYDGSIDGASAIAMHNAIAAALEAERRVAGLLAEELAAWRDNAEDNHDQNYGFCRPGCTKCKQRKAWETSKATDANPGARAAIEKARQSK